MSEKKNTSREILRAGFVGGGRIADLQAIGWLEHPDAAIGAICDLNEAVRSARASEWGAKPYADFDEMLADDSIDVVEILTPHHLHVDQAIAALEAGKHVSLQKPPATSLDDYDRLYGPVEAAAEKGVQFRVFENFMWYPPHVLARKLIDEGEIGDVLSVRLITAAGKQGSGQGWHIPPEAHAWRLDPSLAGGGMATFDHGYHCFHMGRMFIDDPVETVHAFINVIELPGGGMIDAPAMITWRYSGMPRYGSWEVIASLGLDVRSDYYVSDDRMEIRGSKGIIWVNQCQGRLLEEAPVVLYSDGVESAFHTIEWDWSSSFRDGTFALVESILGGIPPRLDIDDARETLAFAIGAQVSAAEHREVGLGEFERESGS